MPSIWILIALIVFGRMWGAVGILLAIPVAAILDFIWDGFLQWLEERKGKRAAAEEAARKISHRKDGRTEDGSAE